MTPFLRSSSGGSHFIKTDVEDSTSIVTLIGLPEGAAVIKGMDEWTSKNHTHIYKNVTQSKSQTLRCKNRTYHLVASLQSQLH